MEIPYKWKCEIFSGIMDCPILADITVCDWMRYVREVRAYTAGIPDYGRKFYLVCGGFACGLTGVHDVRFQDEDWISFEDLVRILEYKLFCCVIENLGLN